MVGRRAVLHDLPSHGLPVPTHGRPEPPPAPGPSSPPRYTPATQGVRHCPLPPRPGVPRSAGTPTLSGVGVGRCGQQEGFQRPSALCQHWAGQILVKQSLLVPHPRVPRGWWAPRRHSVRKKMCMCIYTKYNRHILRSLMSEFQPSRGEALTNTALTSNGGTVRKRPTSPVSGPPEGRGRARRCLPAPRGAVLSPKLGLRAPRSAPQWPFRSALHPRMVQPFW